MRHRTRIRIRKLMLIGGMLVAAYLLSAVIVLDFSQVAFPNDEEYFAGRQVAFGPRPHLLFCSPHYPAFPAGDSYDGEEWALAFYRPICQIWAVHEGFELPHRWR